MFIFNADSPHTYPTVSSMDLSTFLSGNYCWVRDALLKGVAQRSAALRLLKKMHAELRDVRLAARVFGRLEAP